jgi:hypothetical protein
MDVMAEKVTKGVFFMITVVLVVLIQATIQETNPSAMFGNGLDWT